MFSKEEWAICPESDIKKVYFNYMCHLMQLGGS
jgi:hypothetical protein